MHRMECPSQSMLMHWCNEGSSTNPQAEGGVLNLDQYATLFRVVTPNWYAPLHSGHCGHCVDFPRGLNASLFL